MNRRCTTDFAISETRERAATFALSAMVTLSLLAGVDNVADRQYESAYIAQLPATTMIVAGNLSQLNRSALLHESI